MFLDTRSFQKESYWRDALNMPGGQNLPGTSTTTSALWDLSDTINDLPDRSEAFTYHVVEKPVQNRNPTRDTTDTRNTMESDSSWHLANASRHEGAVSVEQADSRHSASEEEENEDFPMPRSRSSNSARSSVRVTQNDDISSEEYVDVLDEDYDPDDEGTEESVLFSSLYGGRRVFGNMVNFQHQHSICDDLPCPVLHASVKNIYLLQPSDQENHSGPFTPPMIGMANPLRQAIQTQYGALNMYDRFNMTASIPVLGVVILASQKGRVLVLSLTKLSDHRSSDLPSGTSSGSGHTVYAMRCDCILPFASQEKLNQRPFAPLHGITVGPMQGTQNLPEKRKRWRLILMYQDHSILSYEITKRSEVLEGAMGETLVV
nr:hypothetical protein CFP56_76367 [Quercus suber]